MLTKVAHTIRRRLRDLHAAKPLWAADIGPALAYEPDLLAPHRLMQREGVNVLEEWFRWAEEWSVLLRLYGGLTRSSSVLEIGCGVGRIAFALRFILSPAGTYDGFEIDRDKVDFLRRFTTAYPNFRFTHANLRNTFYNPSGTEDPARYRFPYEDRRFDLAFAASVFTHLLPDTAARYFTETARVLKPGGCAVFSVFLLDNYRPGQPRPLGFAKDCFAFDHPWVGAGPGFAVGVPDNPEYTTAYSLTCLRAFAQKAGLEFAGEPLPGLWSGSHPRWIGTQDMIVMRRPS